MRIKPLEAGDRQWDLKAGFAADGTRMVSLRDLVSKATRTLSTDALTRAQRRDLTLERLRRFPKYKLIVLGRSKPVLKDQALKEIQKGTPLGQFLIETEQNIIRLFQIRARATLRR